MKKNFSKLPLRVGVGIIVINKDNKIFVAKRIDNAKNFWQMPQGGVDKDEDLLKLAEEESSKPDINDQSKYLIEQKIEVLRSLN